jgi:hypothetical protein
MDGRWSYFPPKGDASCARAPGIPVDPVVGLKWVRGHTTVSLEERVIDVEVSKMWRRARNGSNFEGDDLIGPAIESA